MTLTRSSVARLRCCRLLLPALALRARVSPRATAKPPPSASTRPQTIPTSTSSAIPIDPSRLVMIANWIPLEEPAGGPNFVHFEPASATSSTSTPTATRSRTTSTASSSRRTSATRDTFLQNTGPVHRRAIPTQNVYYTYRSPMPRSFAEPDAVRHVIGDDSSRRRTTSDPSRSRTATESGPASAAASTHRRQHEVFAGPRAEASSSTWG